MLKPKPSYRLRDEAQVPTRPTSIMLNSWRRTRGLKMIDLLGPIAAVSPPSSPIRPGGSPIGPARSRPSTGGYRVTAP